MEHRRIEMLAPVVAAVALAMLMAVTEGEATGACPPAPLSACRLAGQNTLSITRGGTPASTRLAWSWRRGPATSVAEFGDPTATSAYQVCVYGAAGLIATLDAPAGGTCVGKPCWRKQAAGFRYNSRSNASDGVRAITLTSSAKAKSRVRLKGRGASIAAPLPLEMPITVQLTRSDSAICFESVFDGTAITRNDATHVKARLRVDATTPMPPLPSAGCASPLSTYAAGTSTVDSLLHDGLTRTFRVYVPASYDASGATPAPVLLLLHGGFGSGQQIESKSRTLEVAEANGFIVVSPDGVANPSGIRTWNAGGCCAYAVSNDIDDVGFMSALLDRMEANLCVDRRRAYAAGMSNGAMMSHRLGCDLAGRVRAVGSVAGAMMVEPCEPWRPVPVIEIHGTGDLNVPYDGGPGCGAAGVPFPSVAETLAAWTNRDGCTGAATAFLTEGDTTCTLQGECAGAADVALCAVPNGGHQWPGGEPPSIGGLPGCPFGYQSQTFSASAALWQFFLRHPPR